MNPLVKFSINSFEELVRDLEKANKPEYLFELEDRIIDEIASITHSHPDKREARAKLLIIRTMMLEKIESKPHFRMIVKSFQNSIEGAIASALYCL
jgi:hypothetical protein